MPDILAVDRLKMLVRVDNLTDSLSTSPAGVTSEWSGLLSGGRMRVMSGSNICCAHHGLSLLISVHIGPTKRTLLFDAGPEGATFLRNTRILGVDFSAIETVVLSHGHWDHAGGLLAAIEAISAVRAKEGADCFVHPGMFAQRALQGPGGELYVHEPVPGPGKLSGAGARVINTRGFYLPPFCYAMGQVLEQAITATRCLDQKVLAKYIRESEHKPSSGQTAFSATANGPKGARCWCNSPASRIAISNSFACPASR